MTVVQGKEIAGELYQTLKTKIQKLPIQPRLAIVTCAPNFETQRYLTLKRRKAAEVGIAVTIVELQDTATTSDVVDTITSLLPTADGLVVQLPLPAQIDTATVLKAVPDEKDPDCFNESEKLLAPVAGAIAAIIEQCEVNVEGTTAVVLGYGRLVGQPVAAYLKAAGASVTVMTEETGIDYELLKTADVVATGIGKPHFITADMLKDGVVLFDAGTSEDGGELVGDAHPGVAEKAALYTPVPGGIGPITIAVLFQNLITLFKDR